jgi:hypothetical protein
MECKCLCGFSTSALNLVVTETIVSAGHPPHLGQPSWQIR